jgi:hypothetical protein
MKPIGTGPSLALVPCFAALVLGVRMFDRGDAGNGLAFVIVGVVGWMLVFGAAWGRRNGGDDGQSCN